jgi:hypothetical protein
MRRYISEHCNFNRLPEGRGKWKGIGKKGLFAQMQMDCIRYDFRETGRLTVPRSG